MMTATLLSPLLLALAAVMAPPRTPRGVNRHPCRHKHASRFAMSSMRSRPM